MAQFGRQWKERFDRAHELGDAERPAKYSLPGTIGWTNRRPREQDDVGHLVTRSKRIEVWPLDLADGVLVNDEKAHRTATWRCRLNDARLPYAACANRVVARLAKRAAE